MVVRASCRSVYPGTLFDGQTQQTSVALPPQNSEGNMLVSLYYSDFEGNVSNVTHPSSSTRSVFNDARFGESNGGGVAFNELVITEVRS